MNALGISKFLMTLSVPAAALALSPAAFAQDAITLDGMVQVEKTVTENGEAKTVLLPPETVIPGDRLIFTSVYRNTGAKPVQDFVVTNPIPAPVAVSDASAAQLVVSVDGGKTFGALGTFKVADEAGALRAATAADVTHIRWTLPSIQPGGSGSLTFTGLVR